MVLFLELSFQALLLDDNFKIFFEKAFFLVDTYLFDSLAGFRLLFYLTFFLYNNRSLLYDGIAFF